MANYAQQIMFTQGSMYILLVFQKKIITHDINDISSWNAAKTAINLTEKRGIAYAASPKKVFPDRVRKLPQSPKLHSFKSIYLH